MSDYGHELEFGVFLTPSSADPESVLELAELADRSGLDLITFQDHPYQPRLLDAWTLISYAAARTGRARLAPNVLNLPLRPPAVVARAVASLDRLSGGRVELGIGAGAFWDGVAAMGGLRRAPGESVEALEEAIDVIRALWDTGQRGGARVRGRHYTVDDALRGPAPAHPVQIWIGAYRPRMLRLTGRKGDGWLPSMPYLKPGDLARGNAVIDEAAREAGRDPSAVRRLLNVSGTFRDIPAGPLDGPPEQWVEELARMALEDGIATFILASDDAEAIRTFTAEVAPGVRERIAAARAGGGGIAEPEPVGITEEDGARGSEDDRLGITPTPDDGTRHSSRPPWDESTRPHRPRSDAEATYTARGRLAGEELIRVHDLLRSELTELRGILVQVREGAVSAAEARSALNEMALRQNDWTLGAFCSRYCTLVAQHHSLEDEAVFPYLARAERGLAPVVRRLSDEHLVIHDAIQDVDRALVRHLQHPEDFEPIQEAIDFLTDALLSHLSYEEGELVEPLARVGFYAGQL
ncbi:MAG TPA: LLM class flavin-dependent oxidoreductase [Candidatus Dormibacteraeota bacterium]|jgi:alkanesulfonate monooxygenase SsuD/methylene tetrahydromethanopterin reductase-like flavin-dependent oxidoreductase (luciferase family)|nr:LLM class flavin-dependent oxidoreductase [Candidatus Dormibacteraeota bacterium]